MYEYRSKCRWNILLYINGDIKEIRPGEKFSYPEIIESRFVELRKDSPIKKDKTSKVGRPKKKVISSNIFESSDGSSSTQG